MQQTALKALIDTAIRQQTTAGAITPAVLANLLDAIAGIFPQEVELAYAASLTWNVATQGTIAYLDLTGNCALTINGLTSGSHGLAFIKGNGHTITINGQSITLETTGETEVGYTNFFGVLRLNAGGAVSSGGGGGSTPTAPIVTGLNASANLITIGFDMSVTAPSLAGWSFTRNGAALVPTAASSPAAASWNFTVPTILAGDVILANYNAAVGAVQNLSGTPLASFSNRAVTNNVVSWAALNFTTNKLTNTGGVYTPDGTNSTAGYSNSDVANIIVGASVGGGIMAQAKADSSASLIGLKPSNAVQNYPDFPYAAIISNGEVQAYKMGVAIGTATATVNDKWYGVLRVGNVFKIASSVDLVTFDVIYTFLDETAADMYPCVTIAQAGGKLYYPKVKNTA